MSNSNLSPVAFGPEDLVEALERYATLRDTIQGLEVERDALASQLKEALTANPALRLQTDLYRAVERVEAALIASAKFQLPKKRVFQEAQLVYSRGGGSF